MRRVALVASLMVEWCAAALNTEGCDHFLGVIDDGEFGSSRVPLVLLAAEEDVAMDRYSALFPDRALRAVPHGEITAMSATDVAWLLPQPGQLLLARSADDFLALFDLAVAGGRSSAAAWILMEDVSDRITLRLDSNVFMIVETPDKGNVFLYTSVLQLKNPLIS